jgi:hypothetical protein
MHASVKISKQTTPAEKMLAGKVKLALLSCLPWKGSLDHPLLVVALLLLNEVGPTSCCCCCC